MSGGRLAIALIASLILAPVALRAFGPPGLTACVALWLLATPLVLRELRPTLLREWPGALFVLLTAASADYLDPALGVEQRVSLALVLGSLAYLWQRRDTTRELLRTPAVVLLLLFFAGQIASAWAAGVEDAPRVVANRVSVALSLLAGAVLARRSDGDRVLPSLVILGVLISVPIMVQELLDSTLVLFPSLETGPVSGRAAGLYANPNGAGTAISFSVAFLLGLRARRAVDRPAAVVVLVAFAVALLACASRGAMVAVLVVGAVAWWLGTVRASGRRPLVRAALLGGTLIAAVPLLQSCTSLVEGRLERMGLQNAARLGEVARALTGSPDELLDDDSHRLALLEESLPLIAARPWFGYGTGGFGVIKERGAHNQFLAVLGENGVVGALLYLAFLVALLRAVARAPEEQRVPCVLLMVAWLLHHFDSHNLLDYRNAILPVAYVCGVATGRTAPS